MAGADVATMVEPAELAALSAKVGTTGEHQHRVYGCVVPLSYQVQRLGAAWCLRQQDHQTKYYLTAPPIK